MIEAIKLGIELFISATFGVLFLIGILTKQLFREIIKIIGGIKNKRGTIDYEM